MVSTNHVMIVELILNAVGVTMEQELGLVDVFPEEVRIRCLICVLEIIGISLTAHVRTLWLWKPNFIF